MSRRTSVLLRSNPLLTGNVKLVVDDSGLYLSTMSEGYAGLVSSVKRKIPVDDRSAYHRDIQQLIGNLDSGIIYQYLGNTDNESVFSDYDDQYNTVYSYGVKRPDIGWFTALQSIMVPTMIGDDMPDYFLVLGVPEPISNGIDINPGILLQGKQYLISGNQNYKVLINGIEYASGSMIIPEFDSTYEVLSGKGQLIGKYYNEIHNLNTSGANFRANILSKSVVVKQIDIKNGPVGKYLSKTINSPGYNSESIITDLSNKWLHINGIDIDAGALVSKRQYIGDLIESEMKVFDMDAAITSMFQKNRIISSNIFNIEYVFDDELFDDYTFNRYYGIYVTHDQLIRMELDELGTLGGDGYNDPYAGRPVIPALIDYEITDPDGIELKLTGNSKIPGVLPPTFDEPVLYYVLDNSKKIRLLNNTKSNQSSLRLKDVSINTSDIHWISIKNDKSGTKPTNTGLSHTVLKISSQISISSSTDFFLDGVYVGSIVADTLPNIPSHVPGSNRTKYYHPEGTVQQIAGAVAGAISHLLSGYFISALAIDDKVVIYERYGGDRNGRLEIADQQLPDGISLLISHSGGAGLTDRVILNAADAVDILPGDWMLSVGGWVQITGVSYYLDEPVYQDGSIVGFNDFDAKRSVTVGEAATILIQSGMVSVGRIPGIELGMADISPIRDLDLRVNNDDKSNFYYHEYLKYYKSNGKIIPNAVYKVLSVNQAASCVYNGITYNVGDTITGLAGLESVSSEYAKPILINTEYLNDEELKSFLGIRGITTTEADITEFNQKINYISNSPLGYDRLEEYNHAQDGIDLISGTRAVKWASYGNKDAGGKRYRLNTSPSMGVTGGSPDVDINIADDSVFTHEWFCMAGIPTLIDSKRLYGSDIPYNSSKFQLEHYYNSIFDYFTHYFTVNRFSYVDSITGDLINEKVDNKLNYSLLSRTAVGTYTTMFRGLKINVSSEDNIDGYKFSSLLVIENSTQYEVKPPISINILFNHDHGNVLVLITIVIDDYKIQNAGNTSYEYSYLYMMNSLKTLALDAAADGWSYNYGVKISMPVDKYLLPVNNADEFGNIIPGDVQNFYGVQLYNNSVVGMVNNVDQIKYEGLITMESQLLSTESAYYRLICINEDGLLAVSSENGNHNNTNAVFNKPGTINNVLSNVVSMRSLGMYLIQTPDTVLNQAFSPSYINSSIYPLVNGYWFVENGGDGYYRFLSSLLSSGGFNRLLNTNSPIIKWESVLGGVSSNTNTRISIQRPIRLTLNKTMVVSREEVEPGISVSSVNLVGDPFTLSRYDSSFSPETYDVIKFGGKQFPMNWYNIEGSWDQNNYPWLDDDVSVQSLIWGTADNDKVWAIGDYSKVWSTGRFILSGNDGIPGSDYIPNINKYSDHNNVFITGDPEFGIQKHVPYHVVSSNGDYESKYPYAYSAGISHLRIRDLSIFMSDWGIEAYINTDGKNTSSYVIGGATSNDRDGVFMGSLLSIPPSTIIDLTEILSITRYQVSAIFNIDDLLVAYLSGKISGTIKKYTPNDVVPGMDYDALIDEYIRRNVIKLYSKIIIQVYSKVVYDSNNYIKLVPFTSEPELIQAGYQRIPDNNTESRELTIKPVDPSTSVEVAIKITYTNT